MNRFVRFSRTAICFLVASILVAGVSLATELIANGDFQTDFEEFVVWPGYVGGTDAAGEMNPPEIVDWIGTGGYGLNPVFAPSNPSAIVGWPGGFGGRGINPIANGDAPFRNNGDNDSVVAFLQNQAEIRQDIVGLTPDVNYTLTFDYNARSGGDLPVATFTLNGVRVPLEGFSDSVGISPVGDLEPWYQAALAFPAPESVLSIAIATQPLTEGGDATLLLDNIQLVADGSDVNLFTNGDFETEAEKFDIWPGYLGVAGGGNAPFRDNGDNASSVAFLQSPATLTQSVSGLDENGVYVLSLDFNARNCCGDVPVAELFLNGDHVDDFPGNGLDDGVVVPVGGDEPWHRFETFVLPEDSDLEIMIGTFAESGGDATLLIDNVSLRRLSEPGDFNADGAFDLQDLDLLVMEASTSASDSQYDLNGDGKVDQADVEQWLADSATANGLDSPYLWGDANLDNKVDAGDLNAMAVNWLDSPSTWTGGDFDASGTVDAADLNLLAIRWQQTIGAAADVDVVPEPTGWLCLFVVAPLLFGRRIQ